MSLLSTPVTASTLQNANMILSLEPTEFVPCGRHIIATHPGVDCLNHQHPQGVFRFDRSLVGSFSSVTLDEKKKDVESWMLRKFDDAEEELYVHGHTVIWSRGSDVIGTYTVDGLVNQAIWCSFMVDGEDPHLREFLNHSYETNKKCMEGFAVISDGGLHVFSREGEDFITSLPFQVRKVWKCSLGLVFERNPSQRNMSSSIGLNSVTDSAALNSDNALTTVFCLQHPLREFAPVVKKTQGAVRYMNKSHETIVFCEDNLVMTYDSKHGLHTVWKMRKITQEDLAALENNADQQMQNQTSSIRQMSISSPGTSPVHANFRGSPAASLLSNIGGSNASHVQVGLSKTPHAKNPSLAHLSHTPTSSKMGSPTVSSINYASRTFSPLRNSPHLVRSPATPISHDSLCLNDTIHEAAEPLRPEICFDHVWSEAATGTREGAGVGPASRAFLTEDVCGQKFLVYSIEGIRQVRIVKYGLSNDLSQYIFGAITSLSAKDVASLKDMRMLAVLDTGGNITLYTGNVKMVQMHVTGVPALSMSLSHGLRNATPAAGTPQPVSTPAHPSRPGSALGNLEEVGMLSPVPELIMTGDTDMSLHAIDEYLFSHTSHMSTAISGIPHVVGRSILLQLSNGSYYKADIPQFCTTSLVQTCIKALHKVLPDDTYLRMAKKWYSMRHCPGSIASFQSEWGVFENCLREIIGYSDVSSSKTNISHQMEADISASPAVAPKKARQTEQGSDTDWEYVLESDYHRKSSNLLSELGRSIDPDYERSSENLCEEPRYELMSQLLQNKSWRRSSLDRSMDRVTSGIHPISPIFCALHLVYEEQKLNVMTWENIAKMAKFLQQLANDMGLEKFSKNYAMDHPDLVKSVSSEPKDIDPQMSRLPYCFGPDLEPNIFKNLLSLIALGKCTAPFPIIPDINKRTGQILKIYDCLFSANRKHRVITQLGPFMKSSTFRKEKSVEVDAEQHEKMDDVESEAGRAREAMRYMIQAGITDEDLQTYPHGVALPILETIYQCKQFSDLNIPDKALKLIGRVDLLQQNSKNMSQWLDAPLSSFTDPNRWQISDDSVSDMEEDHSSKQLLSAVLASDSDGQKDYASETNGHQAKGADDNVTRLLFPKDHRMYEVWRLLQSERPVKIDLIRQVGAAEQDLAEQAKTRLLEISNRTMALAVGRGMVYLRTTKPVPTQPFQIPKMDLTGRYLPENTTVTLEGGGVEVPADMKEWPLFHNGVASGLKIMPQIDDTSWIYLNKASVTTNSEGEGSVELTPEHAGFLLAAGLNGHLETMHPLKIHDYLTHSHQMTTIAILLGLGASKCGSCDLSMMRLLSVHVPAFLPPTSTEFEVPRMIQIAAVTAAGFLYLGSAHRLVAEVTLKEIDRPPNPENDDGRNRESYALSCGIALGAVTIGRGDDIPELADLNIPDRLYHYMTGKKKEDIDFATQSIIMEGDQINTEVTAPGAIVALALMFLKTNNIAVSQWLAIPDSWLLLETVKPHHLLLRTMAKCLVMWDYVEPTTQYLKMLLGVVYIDNLGDKYLEKYMSSHSFANHETHSQCYASAIAGAALGIGLRFAGTQNTLAFNLLLYIVKMFLIAWCDSGSEAAKFMGKHTLESGLAACLLAVSIIVAGSGNMEVLQMCRFLHMKLDQEINYGFQMTIHMTIGFLFLGNCRRTLSTSNKAIVSLITSIYPCFPCSSSDNQYHLQALRHFYVLATEQRLLVPIDSATNLPCYAKVDLKYNPNVFGKDYVFSVIAPCMVPESSHLKEVGVNDPRHWPITIKVDSQLPKLQEVLKNGLSVQRRTGFQPYLQDPKGYRSCLALSSGFSDFRGKNLLSDDSSCIKSFVDMILDFCKETANDESGKSVVESTIVVHMSSLLKNFVMQEKTRAIYAFYGLMQILNQLRMSKRPNPAVLWQLKLVAAQHESKISKSSDPDIITDWRYTSLLVTALENHFQRILMACNCDLEILLGVDLSPARSMKTKGGGKRAASYKRSDDFSLVSKASSVISKNSLWNFVCFSIYYSLPSSFLFSTTHEVRLFSGDVANRMRLLLTIMKLGLGRKPTAQILKALGVL